jgi:hypothetical protein
MSDKKNAGQRWNEFRPSKTMWFWSCAGSAVATMVVGFWFGGWVTGGTAHSMVDEAASQARIELASDICVQRFASGPDFGPQLAALKEESSYRRDDLLEEAGWTTMGGMDEPVRNAAALCAEKLVKMEAPPVAVKEAAAGGLDQDSGTIQ